MKFTELYSGIDSFWGRVRARVYAFRTFWLSTLTVIVTALPDILVQFTALDFSFLPHTWPAYTTAGFTIATTLMKAFETTAGEDA
jgi:hypothetical protein